MKEVFQQLMEIFPNKHHPNEKTIRRWRDEAKKWEKQLAESRENAMEFFKNHPIPKWLKNLYLVNIENGEIKHL